MSWACWFLLALLDNKWRDMSLVGYRALVGSPGPIITHFFFSLLNCEMWLTDSWIYQDISSWSWCQKIWEKKHSAKAWLLSYLKQNLKEKNIRACFKKDTKLYLGITKLEEASFFFKKYSANIEGNSIYLKEGRQKNLVVAKAKQ